MVGLFLRLKLTLLRNGLRSGWQRQAGLVIGALLSLPMAGLGFLALTFGGRSIDGGEPTAVLMCSFLFLGWITVPVLGFGTDETLDPARLTLFPLRRVELMSGLLAASAIGVGPIATALALSGAVPGYARLDAGAVIVVVAVAVELALCLAGSRAVITALARLLRTRRGRDLMAAAATLVALSPQLVRLALPDPGGHGSVMTGDLHPAAAIARWSPPGLAGQAMFDAHGRPLQALAELLLAGAWLVGLMWWWGQSLDRAMTTPEATAGQRRDAAPSPGRRGAPLIPAWLPLVSADRVGAVMAKELRYASRDPRRRIQLLMGLLVPLFAMLPALARGGIRHPGVVLVAVFVSFMFSSATSLNSIGIDGLPYWMNVSAGNDPRADLLGKNVASLILGIPMTALVAVGLAAFSGGWIYVPLVVCLGAAVLFVGAGVGDVASVRAPQPLPESSNPWGQNTGQGCAAGLLAMLGFVTEAVLLVPLAVLVAIGFLAWSPMLVLVAPIAIVYGAVLWWVGLGIASRWVWWRLPELLEAVSPKHA